MEILVDVLDESKGRFRVQVDEQGSQSHHEVTLSEEVYQRLSGGAVDRPSMIQAAFRFLLEREPKESILRRFDIPVIGSYFPEFENELRNYF